CNSTLSSSLFSLPPLGRCRPPSPALLGLTALALRARASMYLLENVSRWEAARLSRRPRLLALTGRALLSSKSPNWQPQRELCSISMETIIESELYK
ncbi:hypothetical protein C8R47DRAFT_1281911, partial [Mycena vitilis]